MELRLTRSVLRPLRGEDAASLTRHANNPRIAACLRDLFPHPYTLANAEWFIGHVSGQNPPEVLTVAIEGQAAGVIGLQMGTDVHRRSAELGYWLGEEFWGRGIMSEAVAAFVEYAFLNFPLIRIHSEVFAANPASARVLEKAGFSYEGRLRQAIIKNDQVIDGLLYAVTR